MKLQKAPKGHRYPVAIISMAVWLYHRFNHSYRDVQEQMAYRGAIMSHEAIRYWCTKFADHFKNVIRKREQRTSDKWHLDEMSLRVNGFHRQIRKYTKTKGAFTSENALLKLTYCAIIQITSKWSMPIPNWADAISELDLIFPNRI